MGLFSNFNHSYDPWARSKLSRNDDYATAAFISISQNGQKIGSSNDDYPRYLNSEYRVHDPIKYHKNLISNGFLVEASAEVALKKLKVEQLKNILLQSGLSDKGKKDALISRIIEGTDVNSLKLEKYYVPSEKGRAHLKKYGYVLTLRNYDIRWDEYDEFKKSRPDYWKPNDVIWRLLESRLNSYYIDGSYGLARNQLFNMAKLLESEGHYLDSLCYYCKVLYYDTSGCGNGNISDDNLMIAPGLIDCIHKLKDHYDPRILDRCYHRTYLPHHSLTRKAFEQLLFDIFEDKTIDIENYAKDFKG